ncbi:hypothetical protein V8D89_009834 [Ganoderma adspersum]
MQFFTLFAAAIATFTTTAVAAPGNYVNRGENGTVTGQNVRVGFTLDLQPNTPLSSLSCSATFAKKFPKFRTLSQLPTAPFYGEIPGAVDGSPKCGSCWKLQYCDQPPVYMIAVDNAAIIQLGKPAFDKFAGPEGTAKGSVNATAVEVSPDFCKLC